MTGPVTLTVDEGTIVGVEFGADAPEHGAGLLTAGMVDVQVNGFAGVDFAQASPEELGAAARAIARTGVTSFIPTLISAPVDALAAQIVRLTAMLPGPDDGAQALGLHLEGPFLSNRKAGAHDRSALRDPDPAALDLLLEAGAGRVALMTLAPERTGGLEAIARLRERGVVASIGHSDATGEVVREAVDAGATMVTHLFNAQRGLHHRDPGVVGEALADSRLSLGLIADLHHVSPTALRVAFAAAADRVVLVTDAVAAAGMPPGSYPLGGEPAVVDAPGEPPRRADGTLAGSGLTLDAAVRNAVACGVDPVAALLAATRNAALAVGRPNLGVIEIGAPADLVWWADDFTVRAVWTGGVPVRTT